MPQQFRQSDGDDVIFGDLGNDWIVGGTGRDHLYGGWGNDLLNADDVMGGRNVFVDANGVRTTLITRHGREIAAVNALPMPMNMPTCASTSRPEKASAITAARFAMPPEGRNSAAGSGASNRCNRTSVRRNAWASFSAGLARYHQTYAALFATEVALAAPGPGRRPLRASSRPASSRSAKTALTQFLPRHASANDWTHPRASP